VVGLVRGRRGQNHRTCLGGELDGGLPDTPAGAVDQQRVAGADAGGLDGLVRGHAGGGQRGGHGERQRVGDRRYGAVLVGDGVLGVGALAHFHPHELAVHAIARAEAGDAGTDRLDHAGAVRAHDQGEGMRDNVLEGAVGDLPVERVQAGGVQAHQQLAGTRRGHGQVGERGLGGEVGDHYGFHGGSSQPARQARPGSAIVWWVCAALACR
jgi:hypothetical protein